MSVPKLHPVNSSCVARIGYDPATEEAYVEFHDADIYAYRGVSALGPIPVGLPPAELREPA